MAKPDHTSSARQSRYLKRLKERGFIKVPVLIPDTQHARDAVHALAKELRGGIDMPTDERGKRWAEARKLAGSAASPTLVAQVFAHEEWKRNGREGDANEYIASKQGPLHFECIDRKV